MKCIRNFALCRSKYIAQYKCSTCIISILHGNISSCFLFYVFPFFPSSARLSPPRKKTVFRQNVQKQHLYRAEHKLFFCLFRKEIPERVYIKEENWGKILFQIKLNMRGQNARLERISVEFSIAVSILFDYSISYRLLGLFKSIKKVVSI